MKQAALETAIPGLGQVEVAVEACTRALAGLGIGAVSEDNTAERVAAAGSRHHTQCSAAIRTLVAEGTALAVQAMDLWRADRRTA